MSLLGLLDERRGQSAIVYCFSRKDTEELAEPGSPASGHPAVAYHAGLDADTRRLTQERFIDGEVPIVAATIAFGMGIDKPDIRLVVHNTLPKSIEGYYQETGRAGRDGLPSDCVLFFNEGDRAKQEYFIRAMTGEARAVAEKQLQQMVDYCRLPTCRRRYLLQYFGDTPDESSCGACDVCLAQRQAVDVTVVAQKLLSAVIRTGERFGIAHVSDVLLGSGKQRIKELGHDKLSVYGIVNDYDRSGLRDIANGLAERGLLAREDGQYPTVSVTNAGREWLRNRETLTLDMRIDEPSPQSRLSRARRSNSGGAAAPNTGYDDALFEQLRALRRRLADEEGVPAFVVFGDATLRGLAEAKPITPEAMLRVSGVGPAKLERYGEAFLTVIREYIGDSRRGNDRTPHAATGRPVSGSDVRLPGATHRLTHQLLQRGLTIAEISAERGLSQGTVLSHVERIVNAGEVVDLSRLLPSPDRTGKITAALQAAGNERLAPVRELLGDDYSYDEIRLVRLANGGAKT